VASMSALTWSKLTSGAKTAKRTILKGLDCILLC